MLNKILKIIGLISLFVFSLFYTDKVVTVVKEQDPIMQEINNYKDIYNISAVNAIVEEETIIPGMNGCEVDINISYMNMKDNGQYNPNLIEYKEVKPKISISNVYDKYITRGNSEKNEVSLVFSLTNEEYLSKLLKVLEKYNIKASFFVDGKYIEQEPERVYDIIEANNEVYNLGYDGKYEDDMIEWINNLIDTIAKNKSHYCLVLKSDQSILDMCSKYHMHTIKPSVIVNSSNNLSIVKKIIGKGSIVTFDVNSKTDSQLVDTINYLNRKGYTYNLLSDHLSEKRCD